MNKISYTAKLLTKRLYHLLYRKGSIKEKFNALVKYYKAVLEKVYLSV